MKRITFAAIKKALAAVELDTSAYERESDTFMTFLSDYDAREREEIGTAQAVAWLSENGYDVRFVRRYICGNYRGIEWNAHPYGGRADLIAANID